MLICTPGQAGNSTASPLLLAALRVTRLGPGRPRTTPEVLLGDKAYSARAHRAHLRDRGVLTYRGGVVPAAALLWLDDDEPTGTHPTQ